MKIYTANWHYKLLALPVIISAFTLGSCHRVKKEKAANDGQAGMHFAYDDSPLTNRVLPVMMPYNRLIDPAGKTISFGDPNLENHSLDVRLIPNSSLLVIE